MTVSRRSPKTTGFATNRRHLMGGAAAAVASVLPTSGPLAQEEDPTDIPPGGTLRVAIIGAPPYVADATFTSATLTSFIANHIFEGLFAFDSAMNPQPMLATGYTLSDDKRTWTISIRDGVRFHDGSRLVANDVRSSLVRWGMLTAPGKFIFSTLLTMTVVDPISIELAFAQPVELLPHFLAGPEATIVPAYVADAAPDSPMSFDWMHGTGPYRLVENEPDVQGMIRLERFEGFLAIDKDPDGFAGRKAPYLAAIEFIEVSDPTARVSGLLAGSWHFAETVPAAALELLEADPSIQTLITRPYEWTALHFNMKRGRFVGERMRRAVQLAFSPHEAAIVGFGREEYVGLNPSISTEESPWYSLAGTESYNQIDLDQSRALMADSGYSGQPVRMLATREYPQNYLIATYIRDQLEAVGIPVQLDVSDWATLDAKRKNPQFYELFVSGNAQPRHPATQPFNDPDSPGFWENSAKDQVVEQMITATTDEQMATAIDTWTTWIWRDLPFIKICDNADIRAYRREVLDYQNTTAWTFWNVRLEGEEDPDFEPVTLLR